ncbi:glycosyltransferase family protein [Segatella bryantii]|uniref:hypothetical protein n=1 Tax=Segatella bryantii TaxID=77095 RepID=UPI00088EEB3B|nr:hypothetical protein [Segatella bryantii]SDM08914.1 Glycosyltransferase involved in cell wall bisynthesis [Segatella bryantii]
MNIYFFYPSRIIGGAEYLFVNLANKLSETYNYDVFYVDYNDGFSSSKLKDSVSRINYIEDKQVFISRDSVIVMQLNLLDNFYEIFEFDGNYYPLFWGINPNNLVGKIKLLDVNITSRNFRKNCGSLIKSLIKSGNIIFMDSANQLALESTFFFEHINSRYVPVPIDEKRVKSDFFPTEFNGTIIRFAWLGRLDDDKLPTLITYMNEIEAFNKKKKCSLTIIGNGTRYNVVKNLTSKYSYFIDFVGILTGGELDTFIDSHVDIGVGMGTSVLEFSKRGVPAILKGFMNKPLHSGICNDYIVTNEIEGYSLGSIDGVCLHNPAESNFEDKVDYIIDNFRVESEKCFVYVCNHHTIEKSTSSLVNAVNKLLKDNNLVNCDLLSKKMAKVEKRKQKIEKILRSIFNK